MTYKWFVFVLIASIAATLALGIWKALGSKRRDWDGEGWDNRHPWDGKTFIGKVSWFAVPWPLFIGVTILGGPYIIAVLLADL